MRKSVVFLCVFMLIVLSACGGSNNGSGKADNATAGNAAGETAGEGAANAGNAGEGENGGEVVTLTHAIWDKNQAPIIEQIAAKFTETHPAIKIKVEVTPWDQYSVKLETAAAAGFERRCEEYI